MYCRELSFPGAMRGGKENDARWGHRMRGESEYAQLLRKRFTAACAKAGLNAEHRFRHNTAALCAPRSGPDRLALFC